MKRCWVFALLIFLCSCTVLADHTTDTSYRLGPGDKLHIAVWDNEDLVADVIILPDGTIFFPLIGQIKLEGLTILEAQEKFTTELAEYIRDPKVFLNVVETRTILVKILGEVKNPGVYKLNPGSSATDGIAAAGGPTIRAQLTHVGIFAPNQSEPRLVIALGRGRRLYSGSTSLAPEIMDGDTLFVPETKFPNWSLIFNWIIAMNNLKDLTN